MTTLAEALASTARDRKGPICGVTLLLDTLQEPLAGEVRAIIADRGDYSWKQVSQAIEIVTRPAGGEPGTGVRIIQGTLSRHERGDCHCRG